MKSKPKNDNIFDASNDPEIASEPDQLGYFEFGGISEAPMKSKAEYKAELDRLTDIEDLTMSGAYAKLTKERLNLLGQIEAKPIQLNVYQNTTNGTSVFISIPLK